MTEQRSGMVLESSPLSASNASYIEGLYENYMRDAGSISPEWSRFFEKLPQTGDDQDDTRPATTSTSPSSSLGSAGPRAIHGTRRAGGNESENNEGLALERKQISVLQLINAYRFLGVRHANLDPLKHQEKPFVPELDPSRA